MKDEMRPRNSATLLPLIYRKEIDVITQTSYYRSFNFSFFIVSSRLIMLAILTPYVISGAHITAEKIFLTLSLYNATRLSMTLFFPFGISMGSEALVSIKRIRVTRQSTSINSEINDGCFFGFFLEVSSASRAV